MTDQSRDHEIPELRCPTIGEITRFQNKRFMSYDPDVEIVKGDIPEDEDDICIYRDNVFISLAIIQPADTRNGQGLFLEGVSVRWGKVLIKYLGNKNEFHRQIRDYRAMGFPTDPKAIQNRQLEEDRKNKEREIVFAHKLNHPNITKILAFISTSGQPEDITAIAMEGASVGTLEIYAQTQQIPDSLLKKLALQLANALDYCHNVHHIIHRDVRPRNIYVHDGGNTIKLGNFGYAREEDGKPMTANKGDEVYYKAPEVICTQALTSYSFSVDVYGYALVVWSMANRGQKPYESEGVYVTNHSQFRQFLTAENSDNRPWIRADVDPRLAELMRRCWITETEMNKRPKMSDVVAELERP